MSLSQYVPQGFDARNVETQSFEPLQPGKYLAMIESAEVKPTKSGGAGMNVKFSTLDPVEGRKLFSWINLAHPTSTKAVEIGQQELAKLGKAVGIFQPQDENEFIGKQLVLTVIIDKDDNTRNTVKDYASATVSPQQAVNAPVNAPQAPITAPQTGAAQPQQAPWG
jgi:hypothetical protein